MHQQSVDVLLQCFDCVLRMVGWRALQFSLLGLKEGLPCSSNALWGQSNCKQRLIQLHIGSCIQQTKINSTDRRPAVRPLVRSRLMKWHMAGMMARPELMVVSADSPPQTARLTEVTGLLCLPLPCQRPGQPMRVPLEAWGPALTPNESAV